MSIILIQTDTTVGFVSQDAASLEEAKQRSSTKQFLKVYPSFKKFKYDGNRVPVKFKKILRRSFDTTFIIKNRASRVIKDKIHLKFLKKYNWLYSTSANQSGYDFNISYCLSHSDIIIEDNRGFIQNKPSKIYKLTNSVIKRIR